MESVQITRAVARPVDTYVIAPYNNRAVIVLFVLGKLDSVARRPAPLLRSGLGECPLIAEVRTCDDQLVRSPRKVNDYVRAVMVHAW